MSSTIYNEYCADSTDTGEDPVHCVSKKKLCSADRQTITGIMTLSCSEKNHGTKIEFLMPKSALRSDPTRTMEIKMRGAHLNIENAQIRMAFSADSFR